MLDSDRVRNLRLDRAWSQEQLAELSGLSLRTVQRIEKRGKASMESKKALASVFEVELASLAPGPEVVRRRQIDDATLRFVVAGGLIGLIFGLAGGMFGLAQLVSGSIWWGVAAGLVGSMGLVGGIVFAVQAHKAMRRAVDSDDANNRGDG